MKRIDDDETVSWSIGGQHTSCSAGFLREQFRQAVRRGEADWSDEQIEQELFKRLVPKGAS
jgi:hypothetical protein